MNGLMLPTKLQNELNQLHEEFEDLYDAENLVYEVHAYIEAWNVFLEERASQGLLSRLKKYNDSVEREREEGRKKGLTILNG
jgi:hypothetical protein